MIVLIALGVYVAAGVAVAAGIGALGAWWLHRRTRLSARNVYLAWGLSVPAVLVGAGAFRDARMLAGALVIVFVAGSKK